MYKQTLLLLLLAATAYSGGILVGYDTSCSVQAGVTKIFIGSAMSAGFCVELDFNPSANTFPVASQTLGNWGDRCLIQFFSGSGCSGKVVQNVDTQASDCKCGAMLGSAQSFTLNCFGGTGFKRDLATKLNTLDERQAGQCPNFQPLNVDGVAIQEYKQNVERDICRMASEEFDSSSGSNIPFGYSPGDFIAEAAGYGAAMSDVISASGGTSFSADVSIGQALYQVDTSIEPGQGSGQLEQTLVDCGYAALSLLVASALTFMVNGNFFHAVIQVGQARVAGAAPQLKIEFFRIDV